MLLKVKGGRSIQFDVMAGRKQTKTGSDASYVSAVTNSLSANKGGVGIFLISM